MDTQEIINRGEKAQRFLNSPECRDTLMAVKMDLFDELARTAIEQVTKREDIHKELLAMDLFVRKVGSYVREAQYELEKRNTQPDA